MTDGWLKATLLRSISGSMIRASGRYTVLPASVRGITALRLSRYNRVGPPVQQCQCLWNTLQVCPEPRRPSVRACAFWFFAAWRAVQGMTSSFKFYHCHLRLPLPCPQCRRSLRPRPLHPDPPFNSPLLTRSLNSKSNFEQVCP